MVMVSIPVVTIEVVRSMGGSRALAGTFSAVAPSSTYVLPTNTVVMIPVSPVEVTNGWPVPRMVMVGGVTSGAENWSFVAAAAAATAAELALSGVLLMPPLPPPPPICAASAAAAAPQFPLTLQANVVLLRWIRPPPRQSTTTSRTL